MSAFQHVPAVVLTAAAGSRLKINLFPVALPDIGDKEVPGRAVKCAAPWIAQTVGPDLVQRIRVVYKRIIGWHRVVAVWIARKIVAVNVHAQNFAQPSLQILTVLLRIAATAAVAECNVEIPIRTKHNLATVVIGKRLLLSQNDMGRVRIGHVGIVCRNRGTRHSAAELWRLSRAPRSLVPENARN